MRLEWILIKQNRARQKNEPLRPFCNLKRNDKGN